MCYCDYMLSAINIFDFSTTAEQISTKLDRKQDLNVLYKVCVFRANRISYRAALASDWLRPIFYFSETAERNSTQLDRRQDRNVLYEFCVFFELIGTRMGLS